MAKKIMVSDDTWDAKANLYELGLLHGNEIARELGVSPQTVSRQMKRRGALKGSRVNETVEDLVAQLDRKVRHAALMDLSESQRRRRVAEANAKAVGNMVAVLLAADKRGELAQVAPAIDSMARACGGKRRRRSR